MVVKIELRRVDGEGVVEIPNGSTVLGRGPFLGCDDKRVSRNHASLEVKNTGDLFLVAKHVNPCYLLKKDGDVVKDAITKGSSVELKDGYHFSLLHDSYTYAVSIVEQCSPTLSMPDEDFEDLEKLSEKSTDGTIEKQKSPSSSKSVEWKEEGPKDDDPTPSSSNQNKDNAGKKRVLPNWMSQPTSASIENAKPVGRGKNTGRKTDTKGRGSNQGGTRNRNQATKETGQMDVGQGMNEPTKNKVQATPEKKATQRTRDVSDSDSESGTPKHSPKKKIQVTPEKGTPRKRDLSDSESEDHSPKQSPKKRKTGSDSETASPKKTPSKLVMSDSEEEEGATASTSKGDQRVPCQYGSKCYRKNVDHRKEFSHPGDDDYKSDAEEEDGDKPECEYGTTCYRKNPQHRKQYKHTQTPKKQRRAKKEAKRLKNWRDSEDPEFNDYDYDDPFLNDESSDDYEPTDSESESEPSQSLDADDEDMRRTLKEAKRFTR